MLDSNQASDNKLIIHEMEAAGNQQSQLSTKPHHSRSPETQANYCSIWSNTAVELGQRVLLKSQVHWSRHVTDLTYSAHLALFTV